MRGSTVRGAVYNCYNSLIYYIIVHLSVTFKELGCPSIRSIHRFTAQTLALHFNCGLHHLLPVCYSFSNPVRFSVSGVVALKGQLYVVGGDDGTSNLSSVEVYNPKTNTWAMLGSSMGIGRSYAGVVIIDKPPAPN